MTFKFSKSLIGSEAGYESLPSRQLRLYKIVDENDHTLSQFFYNGDDHFTKVNDQEIEIIPVVKLFKNPRYLLLDRTSKMQIGEIKINGQGVSYFWKDVPSNPNAIIKLNEAAYYFRRIKPDVEYNVSKRSTWGHFKFILYSAIGEDVAYYSLRMNLPLFSKPNYTKYRPFEGTIEANFKNVQIIALAFYVFEMEFEAEDQKYDG